MAKKKSSDAKLSKKERRRRIAELIEPFRVTRGRGFSLRDYDPDDSLEIASKESAEEYLRQGVQLLARMQDKLYAQDQWGVLLIFQAMDAAGKDGAIKHVMSGINPQGCQVYAFKAPTSEELDHDFLWRTSKSLPERGRIGIFNRSYYEEALVVRVHPEILAKQKVPASLVTKRIWDERFEDIRAFERYLARQGYVIVKFFLHVSRKEQKRPLPGAARAAREELEVLAGRRARAQALEGLPGGLRGRDPRDRHEARAVVHRARGQEVVRPAGGGRARSTMRSRGSACATRSWARTRRRSSPPRAPSCWARARRRGRRNATRRSALLRARRPPPTRPGSAAAQRNAVG